MGECSSREENDDELNSEDEDSPLVNKERDVDIAAAQREASEKENADLKQQLLDLSNKSTLLQEQSNNSIQKLEADKSELLKKLAELEEKEKKLLGELDRLQLLVTKLEIQNKSLAELKDKADVSGKTKAATASALMKISASSKDALAEEREKLKKALKEAQDQAAHLLEDFEARLKRLEEEKKKDQQKISSMQGTIQQKDDALAKAQKQLEADRKQREALEKQISALEKKLASAQSHIDALEQRLKSEKEQFQKQLEGMKQDQFKMARDMSMLGHNAEEKEHELLKVIKLLQPIPVATNAGDASALTLAVNNLKPLVNDKSDNRHEQFGDLSVIVGPLFDAAEIRLANWNEILSTMRMVIRNNMHGDGKLGRREAKRLFSAMRESCITGLNLDTSAPDISTKLVVAFLDYYMHEGSVGNSVQEEIIRRVVVCKHLYDFDLVDMSMCVMYTDKEENQDNQFFLKRARDLVDKHEIHEFKGVLSSLETILYFIHYLDREDLSMTYTKYKSMQQDNWIKQYILNAEKTYPPGKELIKTAGKDLTNKDDVLNILAQLKTSVKGNDEMLEGLRLIFYDWALIMKEKFDLLVLPHHTQVVCMLMLLQFIRSPPGDCGALIAEMSTGEGKSAVIASIALYCVVFLNLKVHVVVDDENLVERDFKTFEGLFGKFTVKGKRALIAHLVVTPSRKESKYKKDPNVVPGMEENADIVYCEARHVQSFYTRLAKRGGTDFKQVFQDRVLILDEVDALVIDEAPNVPFVYENPEASDLCSRAAQCIARGEPSHVIKSMAKKPMDTKLIRSMENAALAASKWVVHQDYTYDESAGKYLRIQNGRVNEGAWSLALEYKNLADHYSDKITYNERLFVMNRPRVFRLYSRCIGLSGSVGNEAEREFLRNVYRAQFFKVPEFLLTCKNATKHVAEGKGFLMQDGESSQWHMTMDKAFEHSLKVPVLVIAQDRHKATELVSEMQSMAEAKSLNSKDLVRSLSRNLYESHPEEFKENIFKCTQPIGSGAEKRFRIAVTDPRGGRGTDYRVTDADADRNGGLMLIIQKVPEQSRDWIQYLGRTARQDKRGQWMAIIDKHAYEARAAKFGDDLLPQNAVATILSWGNQDTAGKIQEIMGSYNRGLRVNELSEEVSRRNLLANDPSNKEIMISLCNQFEKMSIAQIDELAAKIKGLTVTAIPTHAREVGAHQEARRSITSAQDSSTKFLAGEPRSICFLIDRSTSMLSQVGRSTRFDICKKCILEIFQNNVEDHDLVGLYTFETAFREAFPLCQKGVHEDQLVGLINNLPKPDGLTMFYDSVLNCMGKLAESGTDTKFLIALTDGADNMSRTQPNGEKISAQLRAGIPGLNLIVITCGNTDSVGAKTIEHIKYWTEAVKKTGCIGMYFPCDRPEFLADAFEKVAELIDEPEGEVEM